MSSITGIIPLRNYTTLKPCTLLVQDSVRIIPLRNYTTLKQSRRLCELCVIDVDLALGIIPLRNYTTLKQEIWADYRYKRIIPLRNYTTLKLMESRAGATENNTSTKLHNSQTSNSL